MRGFHPLAQLFPFQQTRRAVETETPRKLEDPQRQAENGSPEANGESKGSAPGTDRLHRLPQLSGGLVLEVIADGARNLVHTAWKDGISGQSAGAQDGIGKIANELSRIESFDTHRCFHRRFD